MADSQVKFGQLLGLLAELGFTTDEVRQFPLTRALTRVCRDPENENSLFLFRDRPLTEDVREFELRMTRMHLEYWGFLSPEEFDEFVEEASNPHKARRRAKK